MEQGTQKKYLTILKEGLSSYLAATSYSPALPQNWQFVNNLLMDKNFPKKLYLNVGNEGRLKYANKWSRKY